MATKYKYRIQPGLSAEIVETISRIKKEPKWMREKRLDALAVFIQKPLPGWGADLADLNLDQIYYYTQPVASSTSRWQDVPVEIRRTYEKLGVPRAERKFLGGSKLQYESEVIYGDLLRSLAKKGVVFLSMDEGLRQYPQLVRQYFGTLIPAGDNKFAALNSAVWSGGSFVYIPAGVKVDVPLQAYFRLNRGRTGQFERTLIVAEEGSAVHYIEGCSAPAAAAGSLHAGVVEVIVKPRAQVQYTTVQNWYKNVYNLVTKRMRVEEEGQGVWVDCNLGSKVTMKYPSCVLVGRKAHGEVISLAVAAAGQHQDSGAKMLHIGPDTTSLVTSKSISRGGGRTSYRGMVKVLPQADRARSKVVCDALILDSESRSDTYPHNLIAQQNAILEHEATVSKVGEEQLFYLTSRGLTPAEAAAMVVNGFAAPVVKRLPLEYAVELNRLIELEMEGSVG